MPLTRCDVVIVAPMYDLHARAVIEEIKRVGGTVALASLRHLVTSDSMSIHGDGAYTTTLRIGNTELDLSESTSIWWRRAENPQGRPDGTPETWFKYQEWQSFVSSLE